MSLVSFSIETGGVFRKALLLQLLLQLQLIIINFDDANGTEITNITFKFHITDDDFMPLVY